MAPFSSSSSSSKSSPSPLHPSSHKSTNFTPVSLSVIPTHLFVLSFIFRFVCLIKSFLYCRFKNATEKSKKMKHLLLVQTRELLLSTILRPSISLTKIANPPPRRTARSLLITAMPEMMVRSGAISVVHIPARRYLLFQ